MTARSLVVAALFALTGCAASAGGETLEDEKPTLSNEKATSAQGSGASTSPTKPGGNGIALPVTPAPPPAPGGNAQPGEQPDAPDQPEAPELATVADSVPLYRYVSYSNTDHFYTVDRDDEGLAALGYAFEREEGRVFEEQLPGTIPLYRFYSAGAGDHFYTTNKGEGDVAPGYAFERIEAYVFANQAPGTVALHRYASATDHFYAKDYLPGGVYDFAYEGVASYVYP